jgi:hypothetical protein
MMVIKPKHVRAVFHGHTMHSDITKSFINPTECTTRVKFTLKFYISHKNLVIMQPHDRTEFITTYFNWLF